MKTELQIELIVDPALQRCRHRPDAPHGGVDGEGERRRSFRMVQPVDRAVIGETVTVGLKPPVAMIADDVVEEGAGFGNRPPS